ncbi:MAG: IS256 family transposase, partial [Proteobacteria bacterium]|nr:IS256 family transposase [Pseudomonadota bacterium]
PEAQGLSANTISRLKQAGGQQYQQGCHAPLDKDQWVYIRADGIYSGLRAEESKLCALVVIGVNAQGHQGGSI